MVDLGVNGGEDKYISLKDISARQNISIKYLEQIVTPLHRAGLVDVYKRQGYDRRLSGLYKNGYWSYISQLHDRAVGFG